MPLSPVLPGTPAPGSLRRMSRRTPSRRQRGALGLALAVVAGCGSAGGGDAFAPPGPTPAGVPVAGATAATLALTAAGGALASADGRLVLEIPPGAAPALQRVTVLAISNNAPHGLGPAYRVGPAAAALSAPVPAPHRVPSGAVAQGSAGRHPGPPVQATQAPPASQTPAPPPERVHADPTAAVSTAVHTGPPVVHAYAALVTQDVVSEHGAPQRWSSHVISIAPFWIIVQSTVKSPVARSAVVASDVPGVTPSAQPGVATP